MERRAECEGEGYELSRLEVCATLWALGFACRGNSHTNANDAKVLESILAEALMDCVGEETTPPHATLTGWEGDALRRRFVALSLVARNVGDRFLEMEGRPIAEDAAEMALPLACAVCRRVVVLPTTEKTAVEVLVPGLESVRESDHPNARAWICAKRRVVVVTTRVEVAEGSELTLRRRGLYGRDKVSRHLRYGSDVW